MPKKTLLLWLCLLLSLGATAQNAHYKLLEKGENLLIQEVESGLYLNLFFSGDYLTLHSGTGDASQWKLLKAADQSEVKRPEAQTAYLLQTQMNSRKGQFAYLAADKVLSKAERDPASEFIFVPTAKEGVWQLQHKASGRYAQVGTNHTPVLFAAKGETPITPTETLDPNKVYRIRWSQSDQLFITEGQGGTLTVERKSLGEKQYWKFIPVVGQAHTYTVQNTATGHYIQSCNLPPLQPQRSARGKLRFPTMSRKILMPKSPTDGTYPRLTAPTMPTPPNHRGHSTKMVPQPPSSLGHRDTPTKVPTGGLKRPPTTTSLNLFSQESSIVIFSSTPDKLSKTTAKDNSRGKP